MKGKMLQHFETPEIIAGFRHYVENFDDYVNMAQEVSSEAESYRNFDVGVVLQGIVPGVAEPVVIAGANFKVDHDHVKRHRRQLELEGIDDEEVVDNEVDPDVLAALHTEFKIPTRPPKNCGEMQTYWSMLETVKEQQFYLVALTLAATTDVEKIYEVTNLHTRTLTPCGDECVPFLSVSPNTSRATIINSTGYGLGDPYQPRSLKEVEQLQKAGKEHPLPDRMVPKLQPGIGPLAVELYDRRIANTNIMDRRPSRIISLIARQSLVQAGLELGR